jgi:putative ABC transport system ATP-binding protein
MTELVAESHKVLLAHCEHVTVVFGEGDAQIAALEDVSLDVAPEDSLALIGRSGSGKTTLLHVLGGLVDVASGTVTTTRASEIAYVFQGANLLPHFTSFENVAFAAHVSGGTADPVELLRLVGLAGKEDNLPSELSGGEAQRVALARALAQSPKLLLCDEPTGHLDSDTAARVLELIFALKERYGFALVIATHDADVAAQLANVVELHDGRIVDGPAEA